jgi:AcrR family transcriptional regulator
LIDAASQLLLEEGYAAVTTRRVADRAGLKPQIVHYYFTNIDDLLVAVVRKSGERNLARWAKAVASSSPLLAIWRLNQDKQAAILSMEFMALANHRKAVRDEVKRHAEQWRTVQASALAEYFESRGIMSANLPPLVGTFFMTSIRQLLMVESALGITLAHAETEAHMEDFFNQFGHLDSDLTRLAPSLEPTNKAANPKKKALDKDTKKSNFATARKPENTRRNISGKGAKKSK